MFSTFQLNRPIRLTDAPKAQSSPRPGASVVNLVAVLRRCLEYPLTTDNNILAMSRMFAAIIVSGLLSAGCKPQQSLSMPDLGGPSGTVTWSASAEAKQPVPGIDQASICYAGKTFVVWSAFDGGGGSNWSANVHGFKGQGRLWSRDHGHVQFQLETKDGKTGPVTINEVEYDLENGGLFLVSTVNDEIQIEQLKRDMSAVKFERESLAAFARQDAEITAFFGRKD